ncbi:hypothetical protein pclt_cds_427 [Pandoravirus celtis]|uniref:Uncharacterized protein n=1 Tax=Pandoravirus celtis TaxID=2568002 RepID=A0A4D6EI57_9VIRU|nr:hypothetical protein pclt_cds_427 [Pandoravirus celtis]
MATRKKHHSTALLGPSKTEAQRRRAHNATADAVYDAIDQAATQMGVSRAALRVDVAECDHVLPGQIRGSAHLDQCLVRVRHSPGTRLCMPNALALLYHEVGHLADVAGRRRRRVLDMAQRVTSVLLAEFVGAGLLVLVVIALGFAFSLRRGTTRMGVVEWSLVCVGFALALHVGIGVGHWCRRWALWQRMAERLFHDMEKTANGLAADALLARKDEAGIHAVACMLISTQRCADRGQKVASGHPPAHEEQRALVDHLATAHGVDIVFGPRQGPQRRRRLSMRHVATDTLLWDGMFDALPERTRRHRRRPQRRRHDPDGDLHGPSLWECLVLVGFAKFFLVCAASSRGGVRPPPLCVHRAHN